MVTFFSLKNHNLAADEVVVFVESVRWLVACLCAIRWSSGLDAHGWLRI